MASVSLLSFDIRNVQQVLHALERHGIDPEVALWAVLPQYEDWRLVVASSRLKQYSRVGGYAHISEAMRAANIPFLSAPVVYLREMTDPFIVELRSLFSSVDDTYGMRLGGQKFGDQYIEDGFVYRIR